MVIELTKDNFESEVIKSDIPVLVDFWAGWCSPCQKLNPVLTELAKELKGIIKVCKLDVEEEEELADFYEILSIPTLAVFNKGQIVDAILGVQTKASLLKLLNL